MDKPTLSEKLSPEITQRLSELQELEVLLGHMHPPVVKTPSHRVWSVEDLAISNAEREVRTHLLFKEICILLKAQGLSEENIALAINHYLATENSPPYCDLSDVEESISSVT